MLVNIALLSSLLLQVKPDWVEISQQHYRKPYRPILVKGEVQETTEAVNSYSERNRIYSNHTVNQDWENGDLKVPSNVARVEHVGRPGVKVRNDKRPTGNVIKPAIQVANEKDEERIDHYDYDVRHEISHFVYDIPGKDVIVNKRRPINEHNPNDRNINRHRVETEQLGNKVVRLKENTKLTVDSLRTNRFKEGEIRKNLDNTINSNIRSSTSQPPPNRSKLKGSIHSNKRRVDMKNPEEDFSDNKQNPFKAASLSSGSNRRRIYFFDPPKTSQHEDKPFMQTLHLKNTEANKPKIHMPIGSAISKPHQNPENTAVKKPTEKVQLLVTLKPNRNKKPSYFTAAFKPADAESDGSLPIFTGNAVKLLEEIPSTESYNNRHKEHITIYNYEADSENKDSVLVDTPIIKTADVKNPFVTNHYHNINHGNIRRIDFFSDKKSEGDVIEFNANINKALETSKNGNKNNKPDNIVPGIDDEGYGESVNSNDKFVFTNDKHPLNRIHIKQPHKTVTIQKVQFPEKKLGGKLSLQSSVKYPDNKYLPMEHKQLNANVERTSETSLYLASETPPIQQNSDDDELDTEVTPTRRLDISSLTSANIPEFITKQEPPQDTREMYKDFIETESSTQKIYTRRLTTVEVKVEESTPHWADDAVKESTDKVTEKPTANENDKSDNKNDPQDEKEKKTNPLENVVKFMKVVSETISKNTKRSIKGKVRYLEELRDTIMTNIEDHIDSQWPNDQPRGARGARAARGHVDFPSSEGALMTISFLTFAVFLIKLVLQVIHTYKNKSMMVTPAVYAVSKMAGALRRQPDNSDN